MDVPVAEVPMQDRLWAAALRCRGSDVWQWAEMGVGLVAGEGEEFVDWPVDAAGGH